MLISLIISAEKGQKMTKFLKNFSKAVADEILIMLSRDTLYERTGPKKVSSLK